MVKKKWWIKTVFMHVALMCWCVIAVYPFLRVFSVSLRPDDKVLSTNLSIIPQGASFDAYWQIFTGTDFFLWLYNSLIITVITAFIGLSLASTAGYAFSRFRFPGHKLGLTALLGTQMIPAGMLVLPLFIMLVKLQLTNNYLGLIIAYSVSSVPFSIWILKGYYDTIPRSLEQAAMIDGTSQIGAFYRIILPLSKPALAIAFLFNFMMAWNEYIVARIILQKASLYTWTLGVFELQGQYTTQWGMFCAASILVSLPVMVLFLYSSKWLISGLTLGGAKG